MMWDVRQVHLIRRQTPSVKPPGREEGDEIEIECAGGFVMQVDPVTRTCTKERQRFIVESEHRLRIKQT